MKKIYNMTLIKGNYGEMITKTRLKKNDKSVLFDPDPIRHSYDFTVSDWTMINGLKVNKTIKVDVKTFPTMIKYPNLTGISDNIYKEYMMLNDDFTLLFVDELNKSIYGDTLYNLTGGTMIHNHIKKTGNRIVWDINNMRSLSSLFNLPESDSLLTDEEISNFEQLDYWKNHYISMLCNKRYYKFIWDLFYNENDLSYLQQVFDLKIKPKGIK